jgi:hypothetical protein
MKNYVHVCAWKWPWNRVGESPEMSIDKQEPNTPHTLPREESYDDVITQPDTSPAKAIGRT